MSERALLNLGCSSKIFPEWINIDEDDMLSWANLNNLPEDVVKNYKDWFIQGDIIDAVETGLPNAMDAITMIHVLDHFTLPDAIYILEHCRRIMKKNAVLRIMVEDMGKILQHWAGDNLDPMLQGQPPEVLEYHRDLQLAVLLFGSLAHKEEYTGHKMAYTEDSLSSVLLDVGFDEVEVQAPGVSNIPEYQEWMDTQPEHSLIVEVRK